MQIVVHDAAVELKYESQVKVNGVLNVECWSWNPGILGAACRLPSAHYPSLSVPAHCGTDYP